METIYFDIEEPKKIKEPRKPKEPKIKIQKYCKQCGGMILEDRFRNFCGGKCRMKYYNKLRVKQNLQRQRISRDKIASVPDEKKTKCLVCGNWYTQVGAHVHQRHGLAARLYRKKYGIVIKRNRKKSGKIVDRTTLTPPAGAL